MKNAALQQLHNQSRRRPDVGGAAAASAAASASAVGTDETDGHGAAAGLHIPEPPSAMVIVRQVDTNDAGGGGGGGYQHAEISSSKAAGTACTSEPDEAEISAPEPRSFPARRGKLVKRRQNLRQKLKSNLLLQLQADSDPALPPDSGAAAAVAASDSVACRQGQQQQQQRRQQQHVCSICGKAFTTAGLLHKHARFHVERSIIPCAHCPALFERAWQYESHLVSAHGLTEQHACPDCERVFSHRSQLLGHVQTAHKKVKTYLNIIKYKEFKIYGLICCGFWLSHGCASSFGRSLQSTSGFSTRRYGMHRTIQ
jgi:hypothetical protein